MHSLPSEKVKDLAIDRNIVTQEPEVDCFIEEMKAFYQVSI